MTIDAFAIVLALRQTRVKCIADLGALAKTNPILANTFSITMFSYARIPPLAGFYSKFYLFFAALGCGAYFLSPVAVVTSVIGRWAAGRLPRGLRDQFLRLKMQLTTVFDLAELIAGSNGFSDNIELMSQAYLKNRSSEIDIEVEDDTSIDDKDQPLPIFLKFVDVEYKVKISKVYSNNPVNAVVSKAVVVPQVPLQGNPLWRWRESRDAYALSGLKEEACSYWTSCGMAASSKKEAAHSALPRKRESSEKGRLSYGNVVGCAKQPIPLLRRLVTLEPRYTWLHERLKRKKEAFGGHKPSGLDTWTMGSLPQGPSFGTGPFPFPKWNSLLLSLDLCQTPLLLLPGGMIHSTSVTGAGEHFTKCALTASEIFEIQSEQHWVARIGRRGSMKAAVEIKDRDSRDDLLKDQMIHLFVRLGGLTRIGQIRGKEPIKERSDALSDAVHDAELPTS
ncbi:hypothetical protein HAX54_047749 [Datura stramonium]|uniref:NADH:quinone oxidoreductase/Mrp antiporter transmembrane domain-containing protein n=1 Tax=Datura stramonium TaxID=4076 RepID=A0ABS8ST05_DATST|nr:hypothetical protein [Datura stramonium]